MGYKAFSKNYPEVLPAEGETQFAAIQGYHRRMRILQGTKTADAVEKANAADVSGVVN